MPHAEPNPPESRGFWRDALAWRGSITRAVLPEVFGFGAYAAAVDVLNRALGWGGVETSHVQLTGGVLVLLLVLRTNAGYDRWWEARRLWGGIVNQSRNLVLVALAQGPADRRWREALVRWTAAFSHATRQSLRDQRDVAELAEVLGSREDADALLAAEHLPSRVSARIAALLREARERGDLDPWSWQQADSQRALLVDHVGGCERILRTPMPRVHSIKLRRFILLYLLALPFAIGAEPLWLVTLVTMLVAYPLLAIDRIGHELENPFSLQRASHLPLDRICATIQGNVLALLDVDDHVRATGDVVPAAAPREPAPPRGP